MKNEARIDGITYEVVQYTTREQHSATRPHLAAHMAKAGIVASALLKRPKGRKHYMANHYGADRWLVLTEHGI